MEKIDAEIQTTKLKNLLNMSKSSLTTPAIPFIGWTASTISTIVSRISARSWFTTRHGERVLSGCDTVTVISKLISWRSRRKANVAMRANNLRYTYVVFIKEGPGLIDWLTARLRVAAFVLNNAFVIFSPSVFLEKWSTWHNLLKQQRGNDC